MSSSHNRNQAIAATHRRTASVWSSAGSVAGVASLAAVSALPAPGPETQDLRVAPESRVQSAE